MELGVQVRPRVRFCDFSSCIYVWKPWLMNTHTKIFIPLSLFHAWFFMA